MTATVPSFPERTKERPEPVPDAPLIWRPLEQVQPLLPIDGKWNVRGWRGRFWVEVSQLCQ